MNARTIRRAQERKAEKAAAPLAMPDLADPFTPSTQLLTPSAQPFTPSISPAQLAANRANAQLSSGPNTPAGKAKSCPQRRQALAAKLTPVSASDLTQQALRSALSELTAGPLFPTASSTAETLQSLLKLQQAVANLATSLPALQIYSQNLNRYQSDSR